MGFLSRLTKPSTLIRSVFDPAGAVVSSVTGQPNNLRTAVDPAGLFLKAKPNAQGAAVPTTGLPGSPDSTPFMGNGFGMPLPPQPDLQLPQLQASQIPALLPNPPNYGMGGGMPFIRNAAFANTLGPLMQPNYGLPFVSPYGQYGSSGGLGAYGPSQAMNSGGFGNMGAQPPPAFGIAQPQLQFPGGPRWGLNPIVRPVA